MTRRRIIPDGVDLRDEGGRDGAGFFRQVLTVSGLLCVQIAKDELPVSTTGISSATLEPVRQHYADPDPVVGMVVIHKTLAIAVEELDIPFQLLV